MEEGGFDKQRRNLMVISTIIVAFNVGGADLESLQFQGMRLTNVTAVVWMVWIGFLYVLWRYWLYARPEYLKFRQAFWVHIYKMPSTKLLLKELLYDEFTKREKVMGLGAPFSFDNCIMENVTELFGPRFHYVMKNAAGVQYGRGEEVRLRTDKAVAVILENLGLFFGTKQHFSDVVIPYIVALVTVIIATARALV